MEHAALNIRIPMVPMLMQYSSPILDIPTQNIPREDDYQEAIESISSSAANGTPIRKVS